MSAFIEAAERAASELEDMAMLHGYAAKAALDVLIHNWRDAIRDGCAPADLAADLGTTARLLDGAFRELLKSI